MIIENVNMLELITMFGGVVASFAVYFLRDIRDTLKIQGAHVADIDVRVAHLEGKLE